jgi:hypothetical protein
MPADWEWEKDEPLLPLAPGVAEVVAQVRAQLAAESELTGPRARERRREAMTDAATKARTCGSPPCTKPLTGNNRAIYCSKKCGTREAARRAAKRAQQLSALPTVAAALPQGIEEFRRECRPADAPASSAVQHAIAPVMGFACDLHKALALMPTVAGVVIEIRISRSGAVEAAPPRFEVAP